MQRHPSLIRLSHDHHHGLALALRCRKQALGRLKPMGAAGLNERAREFRAFFDTDLERHYRAEEEILFPLMRGAVGESAALIDELLRDHQRLRELLNRLAEETVMAKTLFDAGDLLERHIRREERELFPLFEKRADAALAAEVETKLGAIYHEPREIHSRG
jgi:iron-sulfur cluster repair protein YtfE (RIC family)